MINYMGTLLLPQAYPGVTVQLPPRVPSIRNHHPRPTLVPFRVANLGDTRIHAYYMTRMWSVVSIICSPIRED